MNKELTITNEDIELLKEMKNNCLKSDIYNDEKRLLKANAITKFLLLQQENSQLKETVNHEHKYGSEIEGKYILEREKNKKAIKYLKYLKDSTAKYSLNTWNLRKLIKILEGDYE